MIEIKILAKDGYIDLETKAFLIKLAQMDEVLAAVGEVKNYTRGIVKYGVYETDRENEFAETVKQNIDDAFEDLQIWF
jgi:hypothetical protein